MSKLLEEFQEYLKKMNQYEHVITLLYWDMKTCTPKLGQEGHVEALTHFSTEVFTMSTSEQMEEMLTELTKPAEYDALTDTWKFIVTRMKRDFDRNKRIPADLYKTYVQTQAEAGNIWVDAKEKSDFGLFAPYLQKMIDLTVEMAGYTDPGVEVYDALLNQYEEGMDSATIDGLFEALKEELIPFVKEILAKQKPENPAFKNYFDPDGERKVQDLLLDYIGFRKDAGSVGETEHPFTLNFSSRDVRLTNHYYENDPLSSIFSAVHEGGHAIFEQNVNPEYDNTVAGSCGYMGLH